MISLLCKIEIICVQGEVNWGLLAVVIPLVLLMLLVASFCFLLLASVLRNWMHLFLGQTKLNGKKPDI